MVASVFFVLVCHLKRQNASFICVYILYTGRELTKLFLLDWSKTVNIYLDFFLYAIKYNDHLLSETVTAWRLTSFVR